MAEEPKSPSEIREVTDALREYKKVVEEVYDLEGERRSEQKTFYNALLRNYIEDREKALTEIQSLKGLIKQEEADLKDAQAKSDTLRAEQAKDAITLAKERIKVLQSIRETNEDLNEEIEESVEKQKKSLSSLAGVFDSFGDSVFASAAKTVAAMKLLGLQVPNFFNTAQEAITDLDDARRELISFSTSVESANELQNQLAKQFDTTRIPITDLGDGAQKAAGQFRMFGAESAPVQASIAALTAQLNLLGVQGGGSIIESIMSDVGIKNAEVAGRAVKGLTMQMKELGITPQKVFEDFQKLMGSFAMFGESAATNIAKASFMAQKMRVDVSAITGFGDQFKEYEGAARTQQRINAVFGQRVINDPQELVRIYHTSGPPGVALFIKQRIQDLGIDVEDFFAGAAGSARATALAQPIGFGNVQEALRFFKADVNELNLDNMGDFMKAGADQAGAFDDTVAATRTMAKQIEALSENLAVKMLERAGIARLGDTGPVFDKLLLDLANSFNEGLDDLSESALFKEGRSTIVEIIGGLTGTNAGVTPTSPTAAAGIPMGVIKENTEETALLTEEVKKNTVAVDKLATKLESLSDATSTAPMAGGASGIPEVKLTIDKGFRTGLLRFMDDASAGLVTP